MPVQFRPPPPRKNRATSPVFCALKDAYSKRVNWILDILFPKFCVGCGKSESYVCSGCEVGLWEQEQVCPGCLKASLSGLTHRSCRSRSSLDGLVCLWTHEGIAKKLLHRANNYFLFDYLTELTRQGQPLLNRSDLANLKSFIHIQPTVISLPDEPKNQRQKGFVSADIVAKMFARAYRLSWRKFHQIRPGNMPVKVLLVADTWTRSEFERWAEKLKKQGATQVWGLALAR